MNHRPHPVPTAFRALHDAANLCTICITNLRSSGIAREMGDEGARKLRRISSEDVVRDEETSGGELSAAQKEALEL